LGKKNLPDVPKFSTMPSAQPVIYRALLTMFARKKRVPIDPPNSGPSVRLIMTEVSG
jgi:hypothetical protein